MRTDGDVERRRQRSGTIWFWLGLVFWLLLALAWRLWQLDGLPAGLHFDEAIDLRQGLRVLAGEPLIYVGEGWGREALYYYPLALMLALVDDNLLALRLTAVICSIAVMGIIVWWARRLADPATTLMAAGWFALSYWPLFASRFGVRHISLPLLMGLGLMLGYRAWQEPTRHRWWLALGLAGGLTLYSYQPARFVPGIVIAMVIYLWLWHPAALRRRWRGLVLALGWAIVTALPLAVRLWLDPAPEAARAATIEPLTRLLQGDLSLVWANLKATLGMFTVSGDPLIAYNIPGRPVFLPRWTGLLFFGGLILALRRIRRPGYALLLFWFTVMLLPTILTASAPNYNRAIGALSPMIIMAALPAGAVWRRFVGARRRLPRLIAAGGVVLLAVALLLTGQATWRDYFNRWPMANPTEWAVHYHLALEEMADVLATRDRDTPLVINSRNLEDSDPYILEVTLDRLPTTLRWADSARALVRPAGAETGMLFLAEGRWVDPVLSTLAGLSATPEVVYDRFASFALDFAAWPQPAGGVLPALAAGAVAPDGEAKLARLPASFDGRLALQGAHGLPARFVQGQETAFVTDWQVLVDGEPAPLAIFVHVVNADGAIVAQDDGLGFPPHTWRQGDRFLAAHRLAIPEEYAGDQLWFVVGLYDRATGRRWSLEPDADAPVPADRLILGVARPAP